MRKRQNYIVGLDLGSEWTRCVVGIEEDSRLRFIGSGCVRSEGWSREVLSDQDLVLRSVEQAVQQAEDAGGTPIEAAVVGIGGSHVVGNISHTYVSLPDDESEVRRQDVDAVVKAAGQTAVGGDRTVLQLIPLAFGVDQQAVLQNPVGMAGTRLDAHVHVITAQAQAHSNACAVVNRASLVVQETVFEPFAAAQAVLEEREREMGVVVVDMGAGSTDFVAYLDNQLRLASSIPVGGGHFVSDVATVLRTPREEAACLIEQYGCAVAEQTPHNVMIEVPSISGGFSEPKPRRLLNQIIEARAQETFELIAAALRRARLDDRLIAGAVLTGGLAGLGGMCDVAENTLRATTRIGLPPRLEDMPDELDHPAWATAIGLLLYGQRLHVQRRKRRDRLTEWLMSRIES